MKFYESHYEEYLDAVKKHNLHPELTPFVNNLPEKNYQMGNMIVYGPSGAGKYTQVLNILKKYSPSQFKHDKKITIQNEKQTYIYHISDIHYEVDMSLLGCNSKIIWNDIFLQIVDIISVKSEKVGFIVCKNFHMIHGELLDIFYSYIQQYSNSSMLRVSELENLSSGIRSPFGGNIIIHFILITENLSFLPNNILQSCHIVNVKRPRKYEYRKLTDNFHNRESDQSNILDDIQTNEIINIKELYSVSVLKNPSDIPKDIFNVVCDNILKEILNHKKMSFSNFRDVIYDILIYNLEAVECLWYILYYLIHFHSGKKPTERKEVKSENALPYLSPRDISDILNKSYYFLKYYNNNYRPIYHLESILFYIIVKLYHYELPPGTGYTRNHS